MSPLVPRQLRAESAGTMQTDRQLAKLSRIASLIGLLLVFLPAVCYGQKTDPIETIRIDSELVDLKVSVVSLNTQKPTSELHQKDFLVLEDGRPQEISFFAAADAPFDLVLLLDLSGSIKDKLKLVRQSAKRFVDATRPIDRVSIVVFTDVVQVVCTLTQDRKVLKKAIDDIEKPLGGTLFWDSLSYVMKVLDASNGSMRRSAVVVMTDGVDNALPDVFGPGSETRFDQLLDRVRTSDTIVFPIYLDTEADEYKRHRTPRSAFALARQQLAELAVASGSRLYRADKLKDLDDVYKQVIGDLGRIYSIGYRPSNAAKDGKWRSVSVQIADRQDVIARTKQGYHSRHLEN